MEQEEDPIDTWNDTYSNPIKKYVMTLLDREFGRNMFEVEVRSEDGAVLIMTTRNALTNSRKSATEAYWAISRQASSSFVVFVDDTEADLMVKFQSADSESEADALAAKWEKQYSKKSPGQYNVEVESSKSFASPMPTYSYVRKLTEGEREDLRDVLELHTDKSRASLSKTFKVEED